MTVPFTKTQKKALDVSTSVAVSAGAGSGKTAVLTERYLLALGELFGTPDPLRRVVAITFTRRAAAEMHTRARREIAKRLQRRDESSDRRAYWRSILHDFHQARISTIHSRCQAILSEFPFDTGLDPDLRVIDATDAELRQVETVIDTLERLSLEGHVPLALLLRHHEYWQLRNLLGTLMWNRDFAERWRECSPAARPEWEARLRTQLERWNPDIPDLLERAIPPDDWIALERWVGVDGHCPTVDVHGLRPLLEFRSGEFEGSASDVIGAIAPVLLTKASKPRKLSKGGKDLFGDDAPEVRRVMRALADVFAEAYARYIDYDPERERIAFDLERALLNVFTECAREYESRLARAHVIDYQGLEIQTARLLDRPGVAARLRQEIRYLLIDEFQDTNSLQWHIVKRLTGADDGPEPPNLFVVGDDKQAIYEFRGGRVEIFRSVLGEFADRGTDPVPMHENFRTLASPLTFCNRVFDDVLGGGDDVFDAPPAPLRLARESAAELGSGSVTICVTPNDRTEEAAVLADWLVDEGTKLSVEDPDSGEVRPLAYDDVAIIAFHRKSFPPLQEALEIRGVPFNVGGGRGFYTTPEVRDVASLLDALTDPRNDVALAATLRSPLLNLSDDALLRVGHTRGRTWWQKLDQSASAPGADPAIEAAAAALCSWRDLCGRVPTATLLSEIWDTTGYRAVLAAFPGGGRRVSNLEKLADAIRAFEERTGIRPAALARWLDARGKTAAEEGEAVEVENADGVTLLTAHNSKGTQFPLVIVTGLDTTGVTDATEHMLFFHDEDDARLGLRVPATGGRDGETVRSAPFELLRKQREARHRAEDKRLSYVALTRARDHLVLAGPALTSPKGAMRSLARFTPLRELFVGGGEGPADERVDMAGVSVEVRRPVARAHAPSADRPFLRFADSLADDVPAVVPPIDAAPAPPRVRTATDFRDLFAATDDTLHRARAGAWRSLAARVRSAGSTRPRRTRSAAALGTLVHEVLATVHAPSDVGARSLDDDIRAHVTAFAESPIGREALAASESATEVEFVVPIGDEVFRGAIDRVFRAADGTWTIVDYKTDDVDQIVDLDSRVRDAGYDVQLALYALALRDCRSLDDADAIRAVLVFTQPSDPRRREFEWRWTVADLPSWNEMDNAVKRISTGSYLADRDSRDPFVRLRSVRLPPPPQSNGGEQLELY